MSNYLPPNIVDEIVNKQLREGDVTFASGTKANNHLDLGYHETDPSVRVYIEDAFKRFVLNRAIKPSFFVPVPTGATGWAHAYANSVKPRPKVIELEKLDKRKFLLPNEDLRKYKSLEAVGMVLDDATSDGGTSEAAADYMTKKGFFIIGIVSLFLRGERLKSSKYPRHHIVHRPIPANIDWKKFKQQGKIEQLTSLK